MRHILSLASTILLSVCVHADEPIQIGSRLELFVDDHLIDRMSGGARLQLHKPERRNVALVTDQPWEGNANPYRSFFQDGDRYRLYYFGHHYDVAEGKLSFPHEPFTCYAESTDGIHWTKPELGLVEFNGSKRNNIILGPESIKEVTVDLLHIAVFKDSNPSCPPDARYKAIIASFEGSRALYALKSSDGLRFELLTNKPVITNCAFDSENLAFWDSARGEYRAYFRDYLGEIRGIKTAKSSDFVHWSEPEWLVFPDAPVEQLYTNQVMPYNRAPHILIGFPLRYTDRGWVDSTSKLPQPELRRLRSSVSPRYGSAVTDCLLMTSRDGLTFKRWGEAIIRPGPARTDSWVYGDNVIAWGILKTRSDLSQAPPELSVYVSEGYWTGQSMKIRRYVFRIDGFVSVQAPLGGGELITKPLVFDGDRLEINYSTSAAGGVWVELLDLDGRPLAGYQESDCHEIFGDQIERIVNWKAGDSVSDLAGKPLRLRFVLKDADLFSFRFR